MPIKSFDIAERIFTGEVVYRELSIVCGGDWKNGKVTWDKQPIGTFKNQDDLKKGLDLTTPEDANIKVRICTGLWDYGALEVLYNGYPVPGSEKDPENIFRTSYYTLLFIGVFTVFISLAAEVFTVEPLLASGIDFYAAIFGWMLIIAAYFVKGRSMAALVIVVVLYGLDAFSGFVILFQQGSLNIWFLLRIIFFVLMAKGIPALRQIKKNYYQNPANVPRHLIR